MITLENTLESRYFFSDSYGNTFKDFSWKSLRNFYRNGRRDFCGNCSFLPGTASGILQGCYSKIPPESSANPPGVPYVVSQEPEVFSVHLIGEIFKDSCWRSIRVISRGSVKGSSWSRANKLRHVRNRFLANYDRTTLGISLDIEYLPVKIVSFAYITVQNYGTKVLIERSAENQALSQSRRYVMKKNKF